MFDLVRGLLTAWGAGFDRRHERRIPAGPVWGLALTLGLTAALATAAWAQDAKPDRPAVTLAPIEQRVEAFLAMIETRRQEQEVAGAAIVVVQGDRVIVARGLGARRLDPAEPATDDTVFAVGSVTKQFTAVAVALAVTEGKLAFDDHPRRFVPGFRLQDPDADARLNMIDLLAHRSGLERSDLTWLAAPFTQAEMFELAFRAKPAAKLRERFLYNNTMYALAGAVAAAAYATTYDRFVSERMLRPLGMTSSTLALDGLTASPNRAFGYSNATGAPKPVQPVDLGSIAAAGSLNSTARDMGQWLRFLNARGQLKDGPQIAPAVFAKLFEPQQATGRDTAYGLGFVLETKAGVLVAWHGGNVPGFTAHVVHVPERGLSFALLTNQDSSQLGSIAQELFWELVVRPELPVALEMARPRPEPAPTTPARPIAPDRLVGQYFATQGGTFDVRQVDGALVAVFEGQPPYPLKTSGDNLYTLSSLNGYSIRFSEPDKLPGRITALLRQPPAHPGGNVVYLLIDDAWLAAARDKHRGANADLIGRYHSADRAVMLEIVPHENDVVMLVTGQPPYRLVKSGDSAFKLEGLPDTHSLHVARPSGSRFVTLTLQQPNVRIDLNAAASVAAGDAEHARGLLERTAAAMGGQTVLDRLVSKIAIGRASAPTHGIEGRSEERVALGRKAEVLELGAFGKIVFSVHAVTNDARSAYVLRGSAPEAATGKALEAARFFAVPHPLHRWKERYATVATVGETTVQNQRAFIVALAPPGLAPLKLYIAADSHLILREEVPSYIGDKLQPTPTDVDYGDYRAIDGVMTPFLATVVAPILGTISVAYASVVYNAPVDPALFELR